MAPPLRRTLLLVIAAFATSARAATPGFEEDFTSGTAGFGGGSAVTRVSTGGVGGASDGYLQISNSIASQLGAFSQAPDLVGDLPADGVTGYSFWLRDVGADNAHEIHVGVGIAFVNFWLSVPGFVPPDGEWQQFSVDLTDPTQWVQIIGTGTFEEALAGTERLLFRHDLPPLVQSPNSETGDFGLDRIQVLPVPPTLPAVSAPGRAALVALLGAIAVAALGRRGRERTLRAPAP
jgi:hypothetical protein